MAFLIDTHCHLNLNQFEEDLEEVIQRALRAGIKIILIPGVDFASSQRAIEISEQYPCVYAAVGVHPNNANDWTPDLAHQIRELSKHPKVVAIGEIGLDYYRDFTLPEQQKKALLDQLSLAEEINKPVILHNRAATHDLWPILRSWQNHLSETSNNLSNHPGVFHSFEGDLETGMAIRENNFYLGVSGPVTFQNARDRQAVLQNLRLKNIILETDAPYLTPHPFRGKRNEPAYIQNIAAKLAELLNVPIDTIASETTRNAQILFSWRSSD